MNRALYKGSPESGPQTYTYFGETQLMPAAYCESTTRSSTALLMTVTCSLCT